MKELTNVLTAKDIEFLTNLANELKEQNKHGYGNRTPIFIQVREPQREWGIDPDYADGLALIIGDEHNTYMTVEDATEALAEYYLDDLPDDEVHELLVSLESFEDVEEFCNDRSIECFIGGYRDSNRYHQMFLTHSAFEQHMKMNGHNYDRQSSYWVDSFFRNPQMERVVEIIEKFATVERSDEA